MTTSILLSSPADHVTVVCRSAQSDTFLLVHCVAMISRTDVAVSLLHIVYC